MLLLGGAEALGAPVEAALGEAGLAVRRVAGPDRAATAAAAAGATAKEAAVLRQTPATSTVLLAAADGFADALAAGGIAWRGASPLLLTGRDGLPDVTAVALAALAPGEVVVLGGEAAVSEQVVAQVAATGTPVRRVGGATRQVTAALVAAGAVAPVPARRVVVARPDDPADALAAGPFAGATGAAVLLAGGPDALGSEAAAFLAARCGALDAVQVVGGSEALARAVLDDALRAARACDRGGAGGVTSRYRVAVDPDAGIDPAAAAAAVAAAFEDPVGWAEPGALAFVAAEDADLTVRFAGGSALPPCAVGAGCRDGPDLVVDAATWGAPPAAWGGDTAAWQHWVVSHLVGLWLGEPVVGCPEPGEPVPVMADPAGGCVPSPMPTAGEAAAVVERYVRPVTVALAGDVHGERNVAAALARGENPLAPTAPVLSGADLAVVNLETAVGSVGRPADKTYVFRAPPALLDAMREAGVDVVTLANNHALDYGRDGLAETIRLARAAGLRVVGAGADAAEAYAPVVVEVDGRRVAVVGLSRVLSPGWAAGPGRPGLASAYDETAAVAAVRAAGEVADHVVVVVHWGVERAACPDAAQLRLARLLTDAGADVVGGHHPHVLQGVQVREAAVVAYSLGNFVWYHDRGESALTGVLTARLPAVGTPWTFAPARISGATGAPLPLEGDAAAQVLATLATRSPGGSAACRF